MVFTDYRYNTDEVATNMTASLHHTTTTELCGKKNVVPLIKTEFFCGK